MDGAVVPADLRSLRDDAGVYVKNSTWLLLEHALRLVTGLLVGVQVARHLGPLQFGNLGYALAIVSIAASVSRLGLDSIVVRRLVASPDASGAILRTALGLRLSGAACAFALICLAVPWMSPLPEERLYIVIIAAGLLFQAADVADFFFQARSRNSRAAQWRMGQILASAGLRLFLIWDDAGLIAFVIATIVDQMLMAAAYALLLRKEQGRTTARPDSQLARAMLVEAAPILLSSVFVAAYTRVDQIVIRHLLGPEDMGLYFAATNISEMFFFVPTMVASVVFPALVAAGSHGAGDALRLRRLLYRSVFVFAIVVAATSALLAPQLIALLYGPRFAPAATVLAIHVWTLVFVAYAAIYTKVLIVEGKQGLMPWLTVIGLAADVGFLWLLVPAEGLRGGALAALLSHLVIATALLVLHPPARRDFLSALGIGDRGERSKMHSGSR